MARNETTAGGWRQTMEKSCVAKGEITEPSLFSQAGMDVAKVMENRKENVNATLNTNLRIYMGHRCCSKLT